MKNSIFKTCCLALITALGMASCKPKDSDIQTAVNNKLKENSEYAGITASVASGVVTLSGNCETSGCDVAAADAVKPVSGVKEVKSNITVAPPAPAPNFRWSPFSARVAAPHTR